MSSFTNVFSRSNPPVWILIFPNTQSNPFFLFFFIQPYERFTNVFSTDKLDDLLF